MRSRLVGSERGRRGRAGVAAVVFGSEKGVGFGWPEVAEIYYRDEKRSKAGLVQLTKMSRQAALLDQWSQMNVVLSKAPFQAVSIIEMMVHVSQRLGCAVIKRFRTETTGRGAKSENSITFRSEITALSKKGIGSAKPTELKGWNTS